MSEGDDTLTGGGGVDRFFGGAGNDTFVLTSTDVTNLYSNTVSSDGFKAEVFGGTGIDTIRLSGGASLDFTQVANTFVGDNARASSKISSIEKIDLATDTSANTVTLALKDVVDMAGFNLFNTGGATVQRHQLLVNGGTNDTIDFAVLSDWTHTGTVNVGTNTYVVYNHNTAAAQVLVTSGMQVI